MTKIHVNSEGNPGPCRAQNGGCPFGSDENHYSSNEEAQNSYENAQKALGSIPNQHGEMGLSNVLETKEAALKVANIISKEGKYAVIIESQTGYPKDGEFDVEEYNGYEEDGEEYADEEDNRDQVIEEFESHVNNNDWDKDSLNVESMYQVKSYDNFEDIKNDNISELALHGGISGPRIENEDDLEVEGENDIDTMNIRAWRTNVQIVKPSKK